MIERRTILLLKIFVAALLLATTAGAQQIKNAIPYVARPLPLSAVRLTGGPLKHAQDLDAEYHHSSSSRTACWLITANRPGSNQKRRA
jgi:hypothetical protein